MAQASKALSKSETLSRLAQKTGLTKKQVGALLDEIAALSYKEARNGFVFPGVGKLVVVDRKTGLGRNPATGEAIQLPPKRVLKFRIAKMAKDAVLERAPATVSARATSTATQAFSNEVHRRLAWLTDALGSNRVAELVGVSRSQPSRWRAGVEGISPASLRSVLDLDYVVTRVQQLWTPDVAGIWLDSPNSHLGGATPLEVMRRRGVGDVLDALDAEFEGAFA